MALRIPAVELRTFSPPQLNASQWLWLVTGALLVALFVLRYSVPEIRQPPEILRLPIGWVFDVAMDWFVETFKPVFRAIQLVLKVPMDAFQFLLHWLPWPATIALIGIAAHYAGGKRLALFSTASLLYMVVIGYWDESMNTLALVAVAVPLSLAFGLIVGIIGHRSRTAERIIVPVLDMMQTIPTFAYLIPCILLFGFGPVVGLVASAVYAAPPMVRNVMLGLERVSPEIVESARMSGCTQTQLLWWVKLPAALPTVMVGVNQTIMAALSTVIIAAIIGGFADIGWEVLNTMRKAQFGQSLLAGLVIALIAMVMDRICRGWAAKYGLPRHAHGGILRRHPRLLLALAVAAAFIAVGLLHPAFADYPKSWIVHPAEPLNEAVLWFTRTFFFITDGIKRVTLFLLMLPLRIGFENSVTPFFWGFSLTPLMSIGYGAFVAILAGLAGWFLTWRWSVGVIFLGVLFYYGTTGIPWPAFILAITVLAFQVGGTRVAALAFFGLWFILLGGAWERAMLSIYLCGSAVFISAALGISLGIWAAHNDRVSAVLRPINDTLQTMPLFVFLIPVLMVFLLGDFTAMLAIVMYAIVPAIRYTEHGIRNVPPDTLEAAKALGCNRWQLLFQVKLPLAIPEIMLGLNQVVMFALAMLVITALVGTVDLGQMVYEALTNADFGLGVIAGLGMALLAMITDRILQAWSRRKKIELGLI